MSAPYRVTEVEWLQLRLDVMALKGRGTEYAESFEVSAGGTIRCIIGSKSAESMIDRGLSRDEQLYYYKTWLASVTSRVEAEVARLPELRKTFEAQRDLSVEILYSYGKGAYEICAFEKGAVRWHPNLN